MAAAILDGAASAERLRGRVAREVERLQGLGIVPGLAVVLVGADPASEVYVRSKARRTREAGMESIEHRLAEEAQTQELLDLVGRLNLDPSVHGILVQLPLPPHVDASLVVAAIDPAKDVDGFHVSNVGLLGTGGRALVPCTPLGCLLLLREHLNCLSGREAVVIGRSNIVGKPMAALLLAESCTVTVAHSRTRDLGSVARRGEIVVAAVGRPGMVGPDWIAPGATVIDVGINRVAGEAGASRLVGDVHPAVAEVAGALTPVPGGVGPMTIACLLANTVTAACRANGLPEPEGLGL